jgi:hypothetical protein
MASTVENHPTEAAAPGEEETGQTAPGEEQAGQEIGVTTDANEAIIEAEEVRFAKIDFCGRKC